MERILKIIIGIILAILLIMWLSTTVKSCTQKDTTEEVIKKDEEDYTLDNEFNDDFFEEGNEVEEDITENDTDETVDENPYIEVEEVQKPQRVDTKPVRKPTPPPVVKPTTKAYSNYARYMILAGSYLMESNAQAMVKKLRSQGYANAEVVRFDGSQYHSVVADRTDDYNTAQRWSTQLMNKGIDNYVHTKQD